MSLMRRLVGKAPEPDPERYTRVRCEACEGTGWLMSGGDMYLIEGMPSVCSSCEDVGRAMETKDADVLSDPAEQHLSTAQAAWQIDGAEPSREVPAFDDDGSDADALVTPTCTGRTSHGRVAS